MKLGLVLPQLGPHATATAVREFAVQADELGYDSLWVQEHLFFPARHTTGYAGVKGLPMPDEYRHLLAPLEILAFVAGITRRVTIGTSVLVTGYHRPLVLAKEAATIDVLSGGRMVLGLGAGWSEDEHAQCDTPFEHRGPRSTELIAALRACWGPDPVRFDGRFFTIPECVTSPKPVRGHLPIAGGFWSPAGRRRCAAWCDIWQPAGREPEEAAELLAGINRLAVEEHGRPPLTLSLRVFAAPHLPGLTEPPVAGFGRPLWQGRAEDMLGALERCRAAGCDEVVVDCTFTRGLGGEAGWIAQPEFFLPLLEAAHR